MAKDDIDVDGLLDRCEQSIRWLSNATRLEGQQYVLGARNALADPSGEDREEAIRNLRLFHEHMARHVGGDFTLPSAADPPALQAVRELRRRAQRDKLRRRRRAAWLGGATLLVAIVGATFAGMSYFKSPEAPAAVTPDQHVVAPGPPSPAPVLPPTPGGVDAPAPTSAVPPAR